MKPHGPGFLCGKAFSHQLNVLARAELFQFSVHPQQTVSTAKTYEGALQTGTEALVFPTPYGNFAGNKGS